jgi:hypothetical protein
MGRAYLIKKKKKKIRKESPGQRQNMLKKLDLKWRSNIREVKKQREKRNFIKIV